MEISQGSPKATNIPNMIGNLMTIENYKVPPGKFLKHFKTFYFIMVKNYNTHHHFYTFGYMKKLFLHNVNNNGIFSDYSQIDFWK